MNIPEYLRASAATLALAVATPVSAQDSLELSEIGAAIMPGLSATVDQHGTCRKITNNGSFRIMVPAGSPAEWSSGNMHS